MAGKVRRILVLNAENKPVLRTNQAPAFGVTAMTLGLNTILLLDCSSSMSGSPLLQVKAGAVDFAVTAQKKGYRIGLISFDSEARLLTDPTESLEHLKSKIGSLYGAGSTNMTEAIELGHKKLDRYTGQRCMVLLTDGAPDNRQSALQAAREAKSAGIDIITIGTEGADHEFLKELASAKDLAVATTTERLSRELASTANLLPLPKPRT